VRGGWVDNSGALSISNTNSVGGQNTVNSLTNGTGGQRLGTAAKQQKQNPFMS
jgi:hypothetical protein